MNDHIKQSCLSAYLLAIGQLALVYNKTVYDIACCNEYKSNIIKTMMKQGITLTNVVEFLQETEEHSRMFLQQFVTSTDMLLIEKEKVF